MPGYVTAAMQRFRHQKSKHQRQYLHQHTPPTYVAKIKYAQPDDNNPILHAEQLKYIQQVFGVFLYYGIAIDNTMLVTLGNFRSEQAAATALTRNKLNHLLDYSASNPNATIRFHASDMILFIHSGASYLSVAKARSRASGVYFLSDFKLYNITFNKYTPVLNGFIFVL